MNPLSSMELNQHNLDAIAGALEGRPKHEVYDLLQEKAGIDFETRMDMKFFNYKFVVGFLALLSLGSPFTLALWSAFRLPLSWVAGAAGLEVVLLIATVTSFALCWKYAKQTFPKMELKQKIHNAMEMLFHQKRGHDLAGEKERFSPCVGEALQVYFGNQPPSN